MKAFSFGGTGRARLLAGVAVAAVVGFAGIAQAQTTTGANPVGTDAPVTTAEATQGEGDGEILVTGYRSSIDRNLRDKRNSAAVVEVITAEDISKFPDRNVADALQRVPGVVITRDGGEGRTVSVRGLQPDLTLTLLNGNYIATSETNSEATRSFNFLLMPSNLLGKAELFKSSEARIDEGGIGGTVILHTRRPLDLPAWSGFVTAEGTYADTTERVDPQLSGQLSWKNRDETFGVLVSGTWQKRQTRTMSATTEDWLWYDQNGARSGVDVNGNPFSPAPSEWWGQSGFNDQNGRLYSGFFMPTAVNFGIRDENRERLGIQATAQWRPTDGLTLTANYFRFNLTGDYVNNSLKVPEWNIARFNGDGNWAGGRLLDKLNFDPSGTIVTGAQFSLQQGKTYYCSEAQAAAGGQRPGGWGPDDCTVPTPQLTGGYSREEALSQTADFEAEYKNDNFVGVVKLGRTWSEGGPSINFRMSAKPRVAINGQYQPGNRFTSWDLTGTPTMTFSPDLQDRILGGFSEIDVGSTDSSWINTRISQYYGQADGTWMVSNGAFDTLQFGVKYRDGSVHRNTGNTIWNCPGTTTRYQQCDTTASTARPEFFLSDPITNIPGGFSANVFPGINFTNYLGYLDDRYGGSVRFEEPDFIYNVGEKIWSGYVQANFKTDRLRGNWGVRVVHTKQRAESTDAVERFLDYFADGPDGRPLACTPGAANQICESGFVRAEVREKTFELNTLDKTYTDVLPSLNVAYDVTSNLVARGAVAKVIARPAFTNLAFPGALNFVSEEYSSDRVAGGGTSQPGWTGSGSNKDLEAFQAWQYDLGLEWYYHRGSVIGVGLFRKDVKNFVVPVSQDQAVTIGGETVNVRNFSTQANGQNGVSQGIEFYAQHTFDFGVGYQANLTFNDTNTAAVVLAGREIAESPLVGSAENQANFTLFYENDRFLARASYNRRGEVVNGTHNQLTIYTEPYEQVDLNVAFNITPQLVLTASVLNLTKSELHQHLGNDTKARFWTNGYSGRIAFAGATFKL